MGAENDEASVVLLGRIDDALRGRCRLGRDALGPEPRGLGQRSPARGGLLGCLPYLIGPGGVEAHPANREEPDVEGLPYGHDERVTARPQLLAGLRYRVSREV
jgi:hypothetical protein